MSLIYLAVENDNTVHERESKVWLSSRNVSSKRVSTMSEAIKKAVSDNFLYIGINAANVNYMPKLRLLREVTNTPILISTTTYTMQEQGEAIKNGADLFGQISDSPVDNIKSVMALVNRLNERSSRRKPPIKLIFYGDMLISPALRQFFLGDKEIELTRTEFDVLYYLMENRGLVLSFSQIYNHVWNDEYEESAHTAVKNTIQRIRQKIDGQETENSIIENVRAVGYRIPA